MIIRQVVVTSHMSGRIRSGHGIRSYLFTSFVDKFKTKELPKEGALVVRELKESQK